MAGPRDTIPRVAHVSYFQAALTGIAAGETFDELRVRIREVSGQLSRRLGGSTISLKVGDAFTLWSPTADAVSELMRLGLVKRQPLPSKRVHVDAHRSTTYSLTPLGRVIIDQAGGESALRAAFTPLLVKQHPYLSSLCDALAEEPILIPEYTEEELRAFKQGEGSWTEKLGADAAGRMRRGMSRASVSPEAVTAQVRAALDRRFRAGATPSSKDVLDTVIDALIVATLESRGLHFDAITFNVLTSWGRQLYILDESRYLHAMPGRVVWGTASVKAGGEVVVARRGLSEYGDLVAEQLPVAYRDLADAKSEDYGGHAVRHPYLEIFKVRALTAFRVGVNTSLADRVIAEITEHSRPAPFHVELHLGTLNWPSSEPAFRLGSRRYYVMLIKDEGEEP